MSAAQHRPWIKVCGTTSLRDARYAIDAGADALGFVIAPSPRQVTPAEAAAITAQLPSDIELFGVFVHPGFAEIVQAVEQAGLNGIQLHASSDPTLTQRLREYFGKRVSILQVLHYPAEGEGFASTLRALEQDSAVDGVLVDSRSAGALGGTGVHFDWLEARTAFAKALPHSRFIVAGGLRPENVAEAIATLRPWGVDVVTGVEAAPGRKNPDRVRAFVERARAAALATASDS